MMMMRWQLAYPGQAMPVIGNALNHFFGTGSMPDGKMTPEFYNSLGAMHGTIMIFLGVVPLAFAAFGNFVVPLQIGAPDMTFPKVNAASYWAFVVGGIIMVVSFFVPGGAAKGVGLPIRRSAVIADTGPNFNPFFNGQTLWLVGFIFLITSSLLGAINFITTIIQLRAPGLTWMRLPFFVWAQFVTAFLLLLAFPPLEAAIVMQLMDRFASTSFFMPSGLVVNGARIASQRRWQPVVMATFVLVSRSPGSLCPDFARHGHRRRNPRQQFTQTALGLQIARLRRPRLRFSLLHRLGPPHVAHRHGIGGERIFPNHHPDHFHSFRHHPERIFHLALGRFDSIYHADAFRHRLSPNVRHRRTDRDSTRL